MMKTTMWFVVVLFACVWNQSSSWLTSSSDPVVPNDATLGQEQLGCDGFTMKSRNDWGARPAKKREPLDLPVPQVVIHHTDRWARNLLNFNGYTDEQEYIDRVKEIQEDHMDDEGYDDIGYNFLIDGYGNVYEGCGWDTKGSHVFKANSGKIGISFIGYFENALPTSAALRAGQNLIACGVDKKKISGSYGIYCHSDFGAKGGDTDCPGKALCKYAKESFVGL